MPFTQVGLARATKRPHRLYGHALVTDRLQLRNDDPGQGSPHESRLETRPEQAESGDPHTTNLAAAAKSTAVDDLTPSQTAQKLMEWSTAKSVLSGDRLIVLSLLAGVFIALGGAFFTAVMAELSLSHGPSRLLGGVAFSTGLLLVCMSGAELSTGNRMTVAAWASGRLTPLEIRRNLLVSYAANAVGALALVLLMAGSACFKRGMGASRPPLPKQR